MLNHPWPFIYQTLQAENPGVIRFDFSSPALFFTL